MSYELDAQFDRAQEAQRQAAESAKSRLAKMKEELASAKAETAAIRAELDDVRDMQRKVQEDAKKKLESAFGEVSDMKEKCAYFMQALKNEKQAGTDLRISAVKKVREELNKSKERVSELEAALLTKSKSENSVSGAAEELIKSQGEE
jgi:DNA repair exonuclease SbcCD ATPase subunit